MSSFVRGTLAGLLDVREMFYTNLLLLGFDPAGHEEKFRVPINRDMFVLPNKKGMEVVMHFLFNRLDSHLCYEEFRDCWPVLDKKQEQQFRKTCALWLGRIAKENKEARFPRIVASLFMSPGGDRFYDLLVHFSDYVLTQVANGEGGRFAHCPPVPLINSTNFTLTPVMAKAIMCHSQRERQRFLDSGQQLVAAQQEWISFATELTHEYRKLSRAVREQDQKMESYIASQRDKLLVGSSNPRNVPSGSRSAEFYLETARKQRVTKLQQVRKYWQSIELFHKNHLAEHQVVQSILDGHAQKYKVDATDIELQVPGILLPECQQQVEKGELSNLYHNGKLDLLSLVQLWGLSLDLLKDRLHESGVPDFGGLQAEVATYVHTHHGQLADAQAIRASLSQLLPQLRQSIAALDAHLDSEVKAFQQQKSQATPSQHSRKETFRISHLGLLPATPEITSFNPSASPLTDKANMRPMHWTPDTTSTPQAVQQLTTAIQKATIRGQPKLTTTSHIPVQVVRYKHEDGLTPVVPKASAKLGRNAQTTSRKKESGKQIRRPAGGRQPETSKKRVRSEQKNDRPPRKASHQQNVTVPHKTPAGSSSQSARKVSWESSVPKAYLQLADQIASFVAGSSESELDASAEATPRRNLMPQMHSLRDPLTSLGQEAFVSCDRLMRTPSVSQAVPVALTDVSPSDTYLAQPQTVANKQAVGWLSEIEQTEAQQEDPLANCEDPSRQSQPAAHPQNFTLLPPSAFESPRSPAAQAISPLSSAFTRQNGITPLQTPFSAQSQKLEAVTPSVLVFSGNSSVSSSSMVDLPVDKAVTFQQDPPHLISFGSSPETSRQEENTSRSSSPDVASRTLLSGIDNGNQVANNTQTQSELVENQAATQNIVFRQLEVNIEGIFSNLGDQTNSLLDDHLVGLQSVPQRQTPQSSALPFSSQLEQLNEAYPTGQLKDTSTTPAETNTLQRDVSSSSSVSSLWSGQLPAQTISPLHSPITPTHPDSSHHVVSSGAGLQSICPLSSTSGESVSQADQHPSGQWSDDDQLQDESIPSLLLSNSPAGSVGTHSVPKHQTQQVLSGGVIDLASQMSVSPLSSLTSAQSSDHSNH